ncbi:hypothetical protein SKAU_G00241550 [Synaphobranchus kaupii]|uniref:Uncharacterized protein n=1 Tax=Synaphobranchus kaupii TaxID=118154 RepID=A0A9Q1F854_SYNKA|nr:hypothetical protein SKAU_G00241550 [Synaphobranchus kaupii]
MVVELEQLGANPAHYRGGGVINQNDSGGGVRSRGRNPTPPRSFSGKRPETSAATRFQVALHPQGCSFRAWLWRGQASFTLRQPPLTSPKALWDILRAGDEIRLAAAAADAKQSVCICHRVRVGALAPRSLALRAGPPPSAPVPVRSCPSDTEIPPEGGARRWEGKEPPRLGLTRCETDPYIFPPRAVRTTSRRDHREEQRRAAPCPRKPPRDVSRVKVGTRGASSLRSGHLPAIACLGLKLVASSAKVFYAAAVRG